MLSSSTISSSSSEDEPLARLQRALPPKKRASGQGHSSRRGLRQTRGGRRLLARPAEGQDLPAQGGGANRRASQDVPANDDNGVSEDP